MYDADKYQIFKESLLLESIHITAYVFRDLFYIIVLAILNGLIFFKVKEAMKKKRYVTSNNGRSGTSIEHTNRVIIIMVIFCNTNNIIGRLPICLHLILEYAVPNYYSYNWTIIFLHLAIFTVYFSFFNKFFLYYITDKNFKNSFKRLFKIGQNQ